MAGPWLSSVLSGDWTLRNVILLCSIWSPLLVIGSDEYPHLIPLWTLLSFVCLTSVVAGCFVVAGLQLWVPPMTLCFSAVVCFVSMDLSVACHRHYLCAPSGLPSLLCTASNKGCGGGWEKLQLNDRRVCLLWRCKACFRSSLVMYMHREILMDSFCGQWILSTWLIYLLTTPLGMALTFFSLLKPCSVAVMTLLARGWPPAGSRVMSFSPPTRSAACTGIAL